MSDSALSKKITICSFGAAILVLFIHSYYGYSYYTYDMTVLPASAVLETQRALNQIGYQIAVQFFFMLSGYLLFRTLTWENLGTKLKSRAKTLVVPYLLWNIIYTLFFFIIGNCLHLSGTRIDLSVVGILKSVFLYGTLEPYWYMFYLIVFAILSPLVLLAFKKRWIGIMVTTILIAFYVTGLFHVHSFGMYIYWFLFFYIGALIGNMCPNAVKYVIKEKWVYVILALVLIASLVYAIKVGSHTAMSFVSIIALWELLNLINWEQITVRPIYKISFIIYTLHGILSSTIQSVLVKILPDTWWVELVVWILYIVGAIFIIYLIDKLMKKIAPKMWTVATGGR